MKNILNDNKNKQSMRNVYGETLALFGEKNKNIVVLDAYLVLPKQVYLQKSFLTGFSTW